MKHLKTTIVLLLTLTLLLSACAACAEGMPYMQQLSQDRYIRTMFLTPESYPEICLSPNIFSLMYLYNSSDPIFIHFPCPPNTYATDFSENSCSFVNIDYGYQYFYHLYDSVDYGTFLDEAEADENILADGSDGVAIYIDPGTCRAHALIGAEELGTDAKIGVIIYGGSYSGMGDQQIIDGLTSLITEETQRITSSMSVNTMENYWTQGRYAGVKMLCLEDNSNALIMTYTLPENNVIVNLDGNRLGTADLEKKFDISISLNTYNSVDHMGEEDPEHVVTMEIGGETYRVYENWFDEQRINRAYVARTLVENAGYSSDEPLYLTLEIDPTDSWTSEDALRQDLEKLVSGVQIDFNQIFPDYHSVASYPSTPATAVNPITGNVPAPADSAQGSVEVSAPAVGSAEAWTCASCGTVNNGGNFCPNCGAARPQNLVCSNCGYVVPEGQTPNFCPQCGNPF